MLLRTDVLNSTLSLHFLYFAHLLYFAHVLQNLWHTFLLFLHLLRAALYNNVEGKSESHQASFNFVENIIDQLPWLCGKMFVAIFLTFSGLENVKQNNTARTDNFTKTYFNNFLNLFFVDVVKNCKRAFWRVLCNKLAMQVFLYSIQKRSLE